jgi:hypothetical protein
VTLVRASSAPAPECDMDSALRLLESHGLVAGGARIVWHQRRRHTTTLVAGADGRSWLVKRRGPPLAAESVTLRAEARFHAWVKAGAAPGAVTKAVPALVTRLEDDAILIFEGFPSHTTAAACLRIGFVDAEFLPEVLGTALGALHTIQKPGAPSEFADARNPVSIYTTCTPEMLANRPPPFRELLKLLQLDPTLERRLLALRSAWRPTSVIHGDLTLENLLVPVEAGSTRGPMIIDWELAGVGDPRWDCGTLIGSYLFISLETWLNRTTADDFVEQHAAVRSAIKRFWSAYESARASDETFDTERDGREAFAWAGYWLLHALVIGLPTRRSLTAVDAAAVNLAAQLLLDGAAAPATVTT